MGFCADQDCVPAGLCGQANGASETPLGVPGAQGAAEGGWSGSSASPGPLNMVVLSASACPFLVRPCDPDVARAWRLALQLFTPASAHS